MKTIIMLLMSAALLSACAGASIGDNKNIQSTSFVVGNTKKAEVVSKLGLPQTVRKDSNTLTHWYYAKSPQVTGVYSNPNLIAAHAGQMGQTREDGYPAGGVELVFDSGDVLTEIVKH